MTDLPSTPREALEVATLPCPFCNCEASREFFSASGGGWSIFCDGCHASAATCDTKAEAVTIWNRRVIPVAEPTPDPLTARLVEAAKAFETALAAAAEGRG